MEASGQFTKAPSAYSQIFRNYLLSESVRMKGDSWGPYNDCFTWILAPESHPSTQREISVLIDHLKPAYAYKVKSLEGITLEAFTEVLTQEADMPTKYLSIFQEFRKRYLDGLSSTDEVDEFQKAVKPKENQASSSYSERELKLKEADAEETEKLMDKFLSSF